MNMLKEKRGVSALVATVLLILITIAGVAIIAGAVIPMITKITQSGQACTGARLNIDTSAGFTCYSAEKKQALIMVSRGAEDFDLVGIQLGLGSAGQTKSVTIREGIPAVASWGFDEGSGNTAYDSSGNGNDGVINGAIWKTGADCISGSCLSFDGVNDYVSIPSISSTARTEEGWFYLSQLATTKGTEISLFGNLYQHAGNNFIYISGGADYFDAGVTTINKWYHIALVFTDSSDSSSAILYVNGVPKTVNIQPSIHTIGAVSTIGGAASFKGNIDEVHIYNRALSADEIKAKYNADNKGNKIIYSSLPTANSANTYRINTENISEVQVAPIVKVGNTEKICDISAKVTSIPKCT